MPVLSKLYTSKAISTLGKTNIITILTDTERNTRNIVSDNCTRGIRKKFNISVTKIKKKKQLKSIRIILHFRCTNINLVDCLFTVNQT